MPKAALAVAGGGDAVAMGGGVLAMAMAPLGPPPILRPAVIISQVLFDPAEFVPDWAKPRPKPRRSRRGGGHGVRCGDRADGAVRSGARRREASEPATTCEARRRSQAANHEAEPLSSATRLRPESARYAPLTDWVIGVSSVWVT